SSDHASKSQGESLNSENGIFNDVSYEAQEIQGSSFTDVSSPVKTDLTFLNSVREASLSGCPSPGKTDLTSLSSVAFFELCGSPVPSAAEAVVLGPNGEEAVDSDEGEDIVGNGNSLAICGSLTEYWASSHVVEGLMDVPNGSELISNSGVFTLYRFLGRVIYQCKFCHFVTMNRRGHMCSMKTYRCQEPGCSALFFKADNLRRHDEEAHKTPAWPCVLCGKFFRSEDSFRAHVSHQHNLETEPYPKPSTNDGSGARPRRTKKFPCFQCKKKMYTIIGVQRHLWNFHSEK
ncbi:unnamed protein product, partial [Cyprideis torosa]